MPASISSHEEILILSRQRRDSDWPFPRTNFSFPLGTCNNCSPLGKHLVLKVKIRIILLEVVQGFLGGIQLRLMLPLHEQLGNRAPSNDDDLGIQDRGRSQKGSIIDDVRWRQHKLPRWVPMTTLQLQDVKNIMDPCPSREIQLVCNSTNAAENLDGRIEPIGELIILAVCGGGLPVWS